MQMILFLAVVIGLGVGGWQVCENTDICYPPDESKVSLEAVVAEVAGVETKSDENAQNSDDDKSAKEVESEKKGEKSGDKDDKSTKSDKSVGSDKDSGKNADNSSSKSNSSSNSKNVKNTGKSVTCQPYLTAQIRTGGNNNKAQVIKLEKFLNEFEGEKLVAGGRYDATDVAAVKRFQKKYAKEVLAPFGLKNPTGEVMKSTLAQINKLHCEKNKNN